jgi:tryptophan synthase alpha chain
MARIKAVFKRLEAQGRKALIPFITAGDPDPTLTVPLMHALVRAGADIIELGVPFSDPMADGPTIQRASERALAKGVSLRQVLVQVTDFRAGNQQTPVVLMGYANPIEAMGVEAFAAAASAAGVDGVLVVDYPPEEGIEFAQTLRLLRARSDFSGGADVERCAHCPGWRSGQRLYLLCLAEGGHRLGVS